jgi:serine/threonine protein kinase
MPPEQAEGESVDERADLYAIGAILYHVLAGVPPYEGKTTEDILEQVLKRAPVPLERLQPGLAPELVTIVRKAMARKPSERYASARELAEDLKRFQTGQLVSAHTYSLINLIGRRLRRYRLPATLQPAWSR